MKSKYIAWAIAPIFLIGCSDYLETPPSVDYGENEVFATRADAEKLLTTLYAEGILTVVCCRLLRWLQPVMREKT